MSRKLKMKREIDMRQVELMLIAAYIVGYEAKCDGMNLTHPNVKQHWKNLENILKEFSE